VGIRQTFLKRSNNQAARSRKTAREGEGEREGEREGRRERGKEGGCKTMAFYTKYKNTSLIT